MSEIEVGGNRYRLGRLNAFEQHHVLRRLGVGGLLSEAKADADSEYVMKLCLSVVERQQKAGWAPVVTKPTTKGDPTTSQLVFDDIKLMELYELVGKVVDENLGDFFHVAVPKASASPASGPG